MIKKTSSIKFGAILLLLLIICNVFANDFEYEKERDLSKLAFKSLQKGDLETFKTYCVNEESFNKMLSEMGEKSEMEKGIKSELSQEGADNFINETIDGFNKALEQAKKDSVDLKTGKYPELAFYKTRFEVTNLKSVKVKFDISTEKKYMVVVDLFSTKDDIFIYDFKLVVGGVY